MLNKKKDKLLGKCPFRGLKTCSNECVFFREGIRFNEQTKEQSPIADCAINIIADNLEAIHNRSYMMQREVGETKNMMALKVLSDMGYGNEKAVVEKAVKMMELDIIENRKQIE